MPSVYDDFDLEFAWNGDFLLGPDKDLKDTSDDGLKSLVQQLHDLAASTFGDWFIYPNRGASLEDFIGEPNTRITGQAIHDRYRTTIISTGLVVEEDLEIRVFPVHVNRVLIAVRVNATPTATNNLEQGEVLSTFIVFDTAERQVFFLDQIPDLGV